MSKTKKITKILIANRGEIACRIIKTAKLMGLKTVAVYSEADKSARHVAMADEAYYIGPSPAAESYLIAENVLAIAKISGADAIHPGYGFLSENAEFAETSSRNGITFIGPSPQSIRAMGLKDAAKTLMVDAGVPVVPGYHGEKQDEKTLAKEADKISYPVLIKAVAGGGGKGMRRVDRVEDFASELHSAQREAKSSFGDDRVLIEKYILKPRHIEIQVFGDNFGNAIHLYERDCSIQRRHQKILEESPAPGMPSGLRKKMGDAAVKAAKAIKYSGAGTVEFIVDGSNGLEGAKFYFMEMNTRLQVEHPVTEMVTGIDLVEWQIKIAEGQPLPAQQKDINLDGHSIEIRLYAEDPSNNFLPATGTLHHFRPPNESDNFRVETGITEGDSVSVFYDPMIAKLVVWEKTRDLAIKSLSKKLEHLTIAGLTTNQQFLLKTLRAEDFKIGNVHTGFIEAQGPSFIEDSEPITAENLYLATLAYLLNRKNQNQFKFQQSPEPNSPWNSLESWRTNLPSSEKVVLAFGEKSFEVGVKTSRDNQGENHGDNYVLSWEDDKAHVMGTLGPDSQLITKINDKDITLTTCLRGDDIYLMGGGTTLQFHRISKSDASLDDQNGPGLITAPMPGRIIEILVKKDDGVSQGDPLVIMETMKMEYTLKAGKNGFVKDIKISLEDQVKEGDPVISIGDLD